MCVAEGYSSSKEVTLSKCVGYAVKPVKGNVTLLFNLRPDKVTDKDSQCEAFSLP